MALEEDVEKKETTVTANKVSYEDQKKSKSLQNRLSKVESQIKQLEIDIQQDDKALASNYDKHVEVRAQWDEQKIWTCDGQDW